MSGIGRLLNRLLEVHRTVAWPDGTGGQQTALVLVGTVRAKVDQPSPTERLVAAQAGSKHSHDVFLLPGADVQRGDHLHGTDGLGQPQRLRVLSVVQPSRPLYSKALAELIQEEGS
ncbi:head-tail adaptor protein [Streptomyces odonnellii]|uniref:head-tail adaptor protein n=1 Tax=Streptomyces odonnellii TaxID=1417980 RepID=UPI000626844B|nr:head-tail adaptor protein [Streptomyces odonnellii]